MRSTPSLLLLPRLLLAGVVAPERFLSMGQIEQFDLQTVSKQITELLDIELIDNFTVNKTMSNVD